MLELKHQLDEAGSASHELTSTRAQYAYELSLCEAAARAPAIDDDELVPAPPHDAAMGPAPDEHQLRLRRRAAELRTRRELHADIRRLRISVAGMFDSDEAAKYYNSDEAAKYYILRTKMLDSDEAAKPELEKLLGAASSLASFLSVRSSLGGADAVEPDAHLLPPPLFVLHAHYFPHLHVLGVCAPGGGSELLAAVDAGDDGRTFPHCRALLAASRGTAPLRVGALLPAVPFRWAQWLGGIEAELPDSWVASSELTAPAAASKAPPRLSLADVLAILGSL
ncbi:hypothetical protein T492DRAFT_884943 [Pavlovales sp. CCMP2436]|nr:hypothetical protein T492DRAFT_884943 [Pavlovales sp. CCMP2436]